MTSAQSAAETPVSEATLHAVLILSVVVVGLEAGMMYAALPTMNRVFGDPVGVGWLITGFLLTSAASNAISSRLGDLFGRRQVLLWMMASAALGSVIAALSTSLEGVILGRAFQGISEAAVPLAFGLAREKLPPARVPHGVSYLSATASISGGMGVLLGGVVVDNLAWPWLFYAIAILALVALLGTKWLLPPSPKQARPGERLDVIGGLLFVPAITLVLFAISKAKKWGWADPFTLGLIGAGLLLLVMWVRYEWKHPNPLIDVRQFTQRQIALTNVGMALFGLGTSQLMLVVLMLVQQPKWTGVGLAVSATIAGAIKIPSNLVAFVTAPWCARLTVKHGARQAMLYSAAFLCVGWLAITLFHDSLWGVVALVLLIGVGATMLFATLPNLIVEAIPSERTSEAIGVMQVVRATFSGIGAQVATFMLASSTISDPSYGPGIFPTAAAYNLALAGITATAFLTLLTGFLLPRRAAGGLRTATSLH